MLELFLVMCIGAAIGYFFRGRIDHPTNMRAYVDRRQKDEPIDWPDRRVNADRRKDAVTAYKIFNKQK